MPRNTRNFWIELEVDGRATKVACGPVSKDGGFLMNIFMRDNGEITCPVSIGGNAKENGELELFINPMNHEIEPISFKTRR